MSARDQLVEMSARDQLVEKSARGQLVEKSARDQLVEKSDHFPSIEAMYQWQSEAPDQAKGPSTSQLTLLVSRCS